MGLEWNFKYLIF